jgi:hypothetical protein
VVAESPEVELTVQPTWTILPAVQTFVELTLRSFIEDRDLAYRLAMATHELFENAVKYAAPTQATLRVCVGRSAGKVAWVALTNESDPEHIEDLRRQFAEMAATNDPAQYYGEMMRRYSRRKDVSRLGLARIEAEGLMRLSLSTEDGVVTIRADPRPVGEGQS